LKERECDIFYLDLSLLSLKSGIPSCHHLGRMFLNAQRLLGMFQCFYPQRQPTIFTYQYIIIVINPSPEFFKIINRAELSRWLP